MTITQNPDPITAFQQARANTTNTPPGTGPFVSSNGPTYNTVQPPTSSTTGTSFTACLYDATNGYGQEYTYTIVTPAPNAGANANDNYTWTLPGGTTLVSGGGTQLGILSPFVTVRYTTTGPKTFTVTQVNNQAPGTCQTSTNFTVNVNPLPASGGTVNWAQTEWCENQTINFTITGGPPNAQVEIYGVHVNASGGSPSYATGSGLPIVTTLNASGNSGVLSFNSGTLSGGTAPTYVDISVAVVVVDQNGCGRVGPSAPGQVMRSITTRVWDTPVSPVATGPTPVCPNKITNPNALINAAGIPIPGAYTYTISNLSSYPPGTTFAWQILDAVNPTPLTPGTDYTITLSSSGGYNNNNADIRFGKHLDAVPNPLRIQVSVTFPAPASCTLPFTTAFTVTVNAETHPDVVNQTSNLNAIASLTITPGLCSGQQAIYAAVPGMSTYQWAIDANGANNNSPMPYAPSFVGPNNTQTVTINWPAFSDVPLRWPRIEVYVTNSSGCVEGDTVTVYLRPVPNGQIVQAESPLTGPCVYNGEDSHIEAFAFVPNPNPPGFTVSSITWSLVNGLGAVYSYTSSGASWLSPGVNDTVRFQFYSTGTEIVQAVVTTTSGCSQTFQTAPFTIYPPPTPSIFGPSSVCHNSTHQYQVTPFINGDQYYWDITPPSAGNVIASPTSHITNITWGGNPNTTYTLR
ncbi:MAG: hypothetical protein NZ481_09635, partial [Candidatus Kapabacteria bacterium]|nr:hypothetical protein [Candidatus Kapabacteria bacterium]